MGLIASAALLASETGGSAPEALLKPWTDALARFEKAHETASDGLVRLLDAAEDKARASGDLEKVKSVQQEKAQFLADQTLPKCVKTATYEKAMETAKTALRGTAQKTKMALVRQKFDADADAIDQRLGEMLGVGTSDTLKGKPRGGGPPDGRIYWVEKKDKGNEFRWLKLSEWVETTHDGTNARHQFKEVARTATYVELYDKSRSIGVRLSRDAGERATDYQESNSNTFSGWAEGAWMVEPIDVVYLTNLAEKVIKCQRFEKDGYITKADGGEIIYLSNRPSPNGLFTHPSTKDAAMVSYDIGALRKSVFRARVGVADCRQYDAATPLKFVVLGDGKKLYTSEATQQWGRSQECEISIRGVKELTLRVECDGPYDFAYAVWCEPRLSTK